MVVLRMLDGLVWRGLVWCFALLSRVAFWLGCGVSASFPSLGFWFLFGLHVALSLELALFGLLLCAVYLGAVHYKVHHHLYNAHIWTPCPPEAVHTWQNTIRKPLGLLARGHTLGVSPLLLDVPALCGLLHALFVKINCTLHG